MMNYVPNLFAGNDTILFVASVFIQTTLVIALALTSGRLLRCQPLLRHAVLLGGLMCVCFCPVPDFFGYRSQRN